MRVSDVMTYDPICCTRSTGVRQAAGLLREFDIGFLPVVDGLWAQRLIGVVTDRDLCLMGLGELHDPTFTTVEDCMATDVVSCTPDTDVRDALAMMIKHQVRRLPVVDQGRTRGVVGISDLIRRDAVTLRDLWMALSRITEHKEARAKAA